jgi:hypothetical protein
MSSVKDIEVIKKPTEQHQAPCSHGKTVSCNVDTYACKLLEELCRKFRIHPSTIDQLLLSELKSRLKYTPHFKDINFHLLQNRFHPNYCLYVLTVVVYP